MKILSAFALGIWIISAAIGAVAATEADRSDKCTSKMKARVGRSFSCQLYADGVVGRAKWGSTNLPEGIILDSESGLLKGTPREAKVYRFTVTVIDDLGEEPGDFEMEVFGKLTIDTAGSVSDRTLESRVADRQQQDTSEKRKKVLITINKPLIEGLKDVKGSAPGAKKAKVTVYTDVSKAEETIAPVDEKTGTFSAALKSKLKKQQLVEVAALGEKDESLGDAARVNVGAELKPTINKPVVEGRRIVEGSADGAAKVRVEVVQTEPAKDGDPEAKRPVQSTLGDVEDKGYRVALKNPLAEEETVKVTGLGEDSVELGSSEVPVAAAGYDWGRVRAYFSGGAIFSKERDEFSDQDIYLGFNIDSNWFKWSGDKDAGRKRGDKDSAGITGFLVNTFADVRLSSLPITATEGGMMGAPAETEAFITSEKVALLQVGVYFPIYFSATQWEYAGDENALFIAPLWKGGLQTITSREREAQIELIRDDDLFTSYSVGFRFGHYKLARSKGVAPGLISYLDITVGRWENFETLVPTEEIDPLTMQPVMIPSNHWRLAFEGRLKVPGVPFQVGVDVNSGKGPDDVRFLFGTAFDVGELVGRLKSPHEK